MSCAHHRFTADYLHICRQSDPNLIECMKKSVETIRPFLVSGISELDIPSIEPMDIGDLLISESTQNNGLRISAKDIDAYGASNFIIRNMGFVFTEHFSHTASLFIATIVFVFQSNIRRVTEYGKQYTVEVFFPKLRVEGKYDINGQLLLLPIRGSGKFHGNFTDCTGNVRLLFEKNDDDRVLMKKFQIKIKFGRGRLHLFNLFNGDRVLGGFWAIRLMFFVKHIGKLNDASDFYCFRRRNQRCDQSELRCG